MPKQELCLLATLAVLTALLTSAASGRPDRVPEIPRENNAQRVSRGLKAGDSAGANSLTDGERSRVICWRSSDHGGYSDAASTQINGRGIPGVAVIGPGCSSCVAGATCSFTISIAPPANWLAPQSESQRRELNVDMAGPAIHTVHLSPATQDDSSFLATFRAWDTGVYRVSIRSSCNTLNYSSEPKTLKPHEIATWQLEVVSPVVEEANAGRVLSSLAAVLGTYPQGAALSASAGGDWAVSSPCARGQYGRWLQTGKSSSRWTPYPCAGFADLKPEQWPAALNKRGIYEINFVGDSHQRFLMLHLRFLITGEVDISHHRAHHAFTYAVQGSDGGTLTLNFGWMGGIYPRNEDLGCSGHTQASYPKHIPAADVWVVDAGYWTGQFCQQPESALATYLPHFLLWAKQQAFNSSVNPERLSREGARSESILAFRPTPPRDTESKGCKDQFTNEYIRAANAIERMLVPHFGAVLFDSWETEAARYRDHCPRDHHFSCPFRAKGSKDKYVMGGEVGEADAVALIYFLLNQ